MQRYKDINNDSNVSRFEIGNDFIIVEFKTGSFRTYTYTYISAGSEHVEKMKRLALNHNGLNSYIRRNNPKYSSKS